ncbi:hypothetical protein L9F63_010824, partial [Diploptera punctata]
VSIQNIHHPTMKIATLATVCIVFVSTVCARPQQDYPPMPYEYNWKVEDQDSKNFYGQNEVGTATGRVDGSYHVWLPDGRLMTVTYYVDGESGFVPTITYQQTNNPFGRR